MRHVEIAETSDAFVILVDKEDFDRSRIEQAVEFLEGDDFAHIPYVDDDERADYYLHHKNRVRWQCLLSLCQSAYQLAYNT
jgi:hypothetical protein